MTQRPVDPSESQSRLMDFLRSLWHCVTSSWGSTVSRTLESSLSSAHANHDRLKLLPRPLHPPISFPYQEVHRQLRSANVSAAACRVTIPNQLDHPESEMSRRHLSVRQRHAMRIELMQTRWMPTQDPPDRRLSLLTPPLPGQPAGQLLTHHPGEPASSVCRRIPIFCAIADHWLGTSRGNLLPPPAAVSMPTRPTQRAMKREPDARVRKTSSRTM